MTNLLKYDEQVFVLPCVVDFIPYEDHCVVDIILLKGEGFKKNQQISYNGTRMIVEKMLKDLPIQTESDIENRLSIRKIRYFCHRIK